MLFGKGEHLTAIASETLALTNIGCKRIQGVVPGEVHGSTQPAMFIGGL